jgi:sugar phosphate isomerase/epimerase
MQLAYCTSIDPSWDLAKITSTARDLGYAGVEVLLPQPTAADPAIGSPLQERELVKLGFEQAGVKLAGIATSLHFVGEKHRDLETSDAVRRVIELASRVKSPHVRVLDIAMPPRMSRADGIMRLADRLAPLAELASDAGTCLLVQNALSFRLASDLWAVIEQAEHPALGIAWDPLAAALAGEPANLAVQVLNSRLQHVILRDAAISGSRENRKLEGLRPLGDGSLGLHKLLDRLRGVGFSGWASVSYPPPKELPAQELLQSAATAFVSWKPAIPAKKAAKVLAKTHT